MVPDSHSIPNFGHFEGSLGDMGWIYTRNCANNLAEWTIELWCPRTCLWPVSVSGVTWSELGVFLISSCTLIPCCGKTYMCRASLPLSIFLVFYFFMDRNITKCLGDKGLFAPAGPWSRWPGDGLSQGTTSVSTAWHCSLCKFGI